MLQRIYGTGWTEQQQLSEYVQKDTNNRDHRIIGKQLDLYHIQEEAPGMIFWHPDGWTIFRELESFMRMKLNEYEYQEVKGPTIINRMLWEKTGHWEHYSEHMFTTSSENREYCVKPMSCPGHVIFFKQRIRSYRDLPLRVAEFGSCHRNEPSGSLHGLMRIRGFTQDDAHIFCTDNQVKNEIKNCINMIYDVYRIFGFHNIAVKLSTRPTKHKRLGSDVMWDRAEEYLASVLRENNILFEYQPDEAVFYGPKIEFSLLDYSNRNWQCGTIQLDFSLPKRLDATYINEYNERAVPVMIHRAILGSIERFIGILTEEYSGYYPTWLAPTQAIIMNITDNQYDYVKELIKTFSKKGIRIKSDLRNEKIGFKIREHTLRRIPYLLICGDKEMQSNTVSVRTRSGKNLGNVAINKMIEKLQTEIKDYDLHSSMGGIKY